VIALDRQLHKGEKSGAKVYQRPEKIERRRQPHYPRTVSGYNVVRMIFRRGGGGDEPAKEKKRGVNEKNSIQRGRECRTSIGDGRDCTKKMRKKKSKGGELREGEEKKGQETGAVKWASRIQLIPLFQNQRP